jgi:succinate dehydrogenase hydrophobic anchor subunit
MDVILPVLICVTALALALLIAFLIYVIIPSHKAYYL